MFYGHISPFREVTLVQPKTILTYWLTYKYSPDNATLSNLGFRDHENWACLFPRETC
jgi:hypothetical protein